jgi:UDP-N-acetylmuramoylalanine--D-glutamate ligase
VRQWTQVQHGVALVGELDLFAQALATWRSGSAWPYRPKVLAITGTNGKTTVTSLTGLLLQRAGRRVAVAGNIGPACWTCCRTALDARGSRSGPRSRRGPAGTIAGPAAGRDVPSRRCQILNVD